MSQDPDALKIILKLLKGEMVHDLNYHKQLCDKILGNGYEYVHKMKDKPSKYLGKGHRVLFHDHATNVAIGIISGDPKAFLAAELHDLMDFSETKARKIIRGERV